MNLLGAFFRNNRGNVAMMFGLAMIGLIGITGLAVEYSRSTAMQARLLAAADAAALAAARKVGTQADKIKAAKDTFYASIATIPDLSNMVVTAHPETNAEGLSVINVSVSGMMNTSLAKAFGISGLELKAEAQATIGTDNKVEVALVLDYSGSMNWNGKYQGMRDAATKMVNDLIPVANAGNVKIGLVPFSDFVYTDILSTYLRGVHPDKYGQTVRACIDSRRHPATVTDATPVSDNQDTKWPAPGMPDDWRQAGAMPTEDVNKLETDTSVCRVKKSEDQCKEEAGQLDLDDDERYQYVQACMAGALPTADTIDPNADQCQKSYDSAEKIDQGVEAVVSDFAADNPKCAVYSSKKLVVKPLTTNSTALVSQLAGMTPVRLTNIALGLEMGWHVVTDNAPHTVGSAYTDPKVKKVIVLLSDGAQTVGGWGPTGNFSVSQADQNTAALCTAIKAKGIRLITVAYDLASNTAARTLLQNCASSADDFFDAGNASQLASVFDAITGALQGSLRLVR